MYCFLARTGGDRLRDHSLIAIRFAIVASIALVLTVFLFPAGSLPFGASEGAEVDLRLSFREDLSGEDPEPYWPLFLELTGGLGPAEAVRNVLTVESAGAGQAEVRTFPLDAPSVPWTPEESDDGLTGALPGDGEASWTAADLDEDGTARTLLVATFAEAGTYTLVVTSYDAESGQRIGEPARAEVTVVSPSPLQFDRPVLGKWGGAGWSNATAVDREMSFSVSANTTEAWASQPWGTYYNWTVTAICPSGMSVGGDLALFNTGDTRVDRAPLNATSAVSAWENGYNTVFYTVWDRDGGVRLAGNAAMTPTGKELAYSSGTWHSWTTGTWTPFGAGSVTFHQPGHYLLVVCLHDGTGSVSPPLLLEAVVS